MKLNTIVTHRRTDFDEHVGLFLVQNFGQKYFDFKHWEDVRILFDEAGQTLNGGSCSADEYLKRHGVLFIGMGGGRFDEHIFGNASEAELARKEGKCSATLVAEDLGLAKVASLKKLLRYAEKADNGLIRGPSTIANLIKDAHRIGRQDAAVLERALFFISAHVRAEEKLLALPAEDRKAARAAAYEWARALVARVAEKALHALEGCSPEIALLIAEDAERVIHQVRDGKMTNSFDIVGLVASAHIDCSSEISVAEQHLQFFLEARLVAQKQLFTEGKSEAESANLMHIPVTEFVRGRVSHRNLVVASVKNCRSERTKEYIFSKRYNPEVVVDIFVQHLPTGHIRIFANKGSGVNLAEVAKCIRALEFKLKPQRWKQRFRKGLSWQQLGSRGTISAVPEWVYPDRFNDGQILCNGTLKTNDIRRTRLTLEEVLGAISVGCNEAYLSKECPQGHCAGRKCPLYASQLHRCYLIRQSKTNRAAALSVMAITKEAKAQNQ